MLDVQTLKRQLDAREDVLVGRQPKPEPRDTMKEIPMSAAFRPPSRFAPANLIPGLPAMAVAVRSGTGTRSGGWHFLAGLQIAQRPVRANEMLEFC